MKLPRRRDRERGATGVEYALILSTVVLASIGAINGLEDASQDEFDGRASNIEDLPGSNGFNDGNGGGITTTTVGITTTTVDSSPTTTAPPATTTQPPSSTTTPPTTLPTTTTIAPKTAIVTVIDASVETNGGKWNAAATVTIKNTITEAPVAGAGVTVHMTAANGSTAIKSCTTDESGQCTATWTGRRSQHDPVQASVTDVTADPTWDRIVVNALLHRP